MLVNCYMMSSMKTAIFLNIHTFKCGCEEFTGIVMFGVVLVFLSGLCLYY